jgi:hypothetical protein
VCLTLTFCVDALAQESEFYQSEDEDESADDDGNDDDHSDDHVKSGSLLSYSDSDSSSLEESSKDEDTQSATCMSNDEERDTTTGKRIRGDDNDREAELVSRVFPTRRLTVKHCGINLSISSSNSYEVGKVCWEQEDKTHTACASVLEVEHKVD